MNADDADKWADALELFQIAQRVKGMAPATIARQVKHVRRFAITGADCGPWHVVSEAAGGWLAGLEVADLTRASMKDSLRAFYRWAVATGRMTSDPTAHLSKRDLRLPVPDAWIQPLAAYERYLWAKGDMPSTVAQNLAQLRSFARDRPSLAPFAVTVDDLYEYMAGKRWVRETRRARRSALRCFYAWAVETERMEASPAARLPIVKAGDPVARPATDDEYAGALERAGDPRWTLALRLSAELGLRCGEVARLHTSDVVMRSDGSAWLTVHGKGGKVRHLPLTEHLRLSLVTLPAGYVFPGQIVEKHVHDGGSAGHLSSHYLGKRISQLLPPGVTMHMLRHRFATRAYNVNRDVFTVQRMLGHASAATTQRYVQVSDQRMRDLIGQVSG